jgi:thiol-disulfide isomerase/thioredoxin
MSLRTKKGDAVWGLSSVSCLVMIHRLLALALAAALAMSSFAQSADPQAALTKISELRKTRPTTQAEFNAQQAEVKKIVEEALKDVDLATVDASKAMSYVSLLTAVSRFADVPPLVDKFLATNPPEAQKSSAIFTGAMAAAYSDNSAKALQYAEMHPSETPQFKIARAQIYFNFIGDDLAKVKGTVPAIRIFEGLLADLPAENTPQASLDSVRISGASILADLHVANGDQASAVKTIDAGMAAIKEEPMKRRLASKQTQIKLIGETPAEVVPTKKIGDFTSLAALKGKIVVLDFFAHWCGPCKASFPDLRKLHADLKSKGVEIVHATTFYGYYGQERNLTPEQEFAKMEGFVKEHSIDWPVVFLPREDMAKYGVSGIPHIVLIDADGKVSQFKIGYSAETFAVFRKKIEELVAANGQKK